MLNSIVGWVCESAPTLELCREMSQGNTDGAAVLLAECFVKFGVAMVYFIIPAVMWKMLRRVVSLPFRSILLICFAFILLSGAGSLMSAISMLFGGWTRWLNVGVSTISMAVAMAACISLMRNTERISALTVRLISRMVAR
ncbi:MAG: hypothetical protein ACLGIM_17885 [Alphaproteobacteria bacterium]